jgi:hypothetical protein
MGHYHWPDLDAFNAPRYGKRSNHGRKRSSKVRVISYGKDGVRTEKTRAPETLKRAASRQSKQDELKVQEVYQAVAGTIEGKYSTLGDERGRTEFAPAIDAASLARPVDTKGTLPSYAQRRAAMAARRGY